jgi:hypothetical protein
LGSASGGDNLRVRAGLRRRGAAGVGGHPAGADRAHTRDQHLAGQAASPGQIQSYAEREQQSGGLERFKGGVGIYIGGSAVVLLLLVILLVLLL